MKKLIVTADDFGISEAVNEAVEIAHRSGILGSASLMVAEPAAGDAVERALRLPSLRVGLHVAVSRGRTMLPPSELPAIVGSDNRLGTNLFMTGVRYAVSRDARRQLEREIRAQFDAFAATGLTLDHADVHNHMHVHPVVFRTVIDVGRDFGLASVRLPYQPFPDAWRMKVVPHPVLGALGWVLMWPWAVALRRQLRSRDLVCNDYLFGTPNGGCVDADSLMRIIEGLPDGISEIHLHPATGPWEDAAPAALPSLRRHEFEALIAEDVLQTLRESGVERSSFGELAPGVVRR